MIWLLLACATDTAGWVSEVHGRVVDVSGSGVAGAEVVLADGESGAPLGTVQSEDDGAWRMPVLFRRQGSFPVVIQVESESMAAGLSWAEVFLEVDDEAKNLYVGSGQSLDMFEQRVPPVMLADSGLGSAGGSIVDASTGEWVANVSMALRSGWNAPQSEAIVGEISTDVDGVFRVEDFESGVYTAHVEAGHGYSESRFMVVVDPLGREGQVGLVSGTLEAGQARAALLWGRTDISVGLHLSGPLSASDGGRGRYQVHAEHPVHPVRGDLVAGIEYQQAGLETARVYSLRSAGVYRVSAHILQWPDVDEEGSLFAAGAQVQAWWPAGPVMAFPTPGIPGNLWNAMEFDVESGSSRDLQHYAPIADPFDLDSF